MHKNLQEQEVHCNFSILLFIKKFPCGNCYWPVSRINQVVDIFTVFCSQNFFTTPGVGMGRRKERKKKPKRLSQQSMNSNEGDGNE